MIGSPGQMVLGSDGGRVSALTALFVCAAKSHSIRGSTFAFAL